MKTTSWLSQISFKQQIWLLTTVVGMFAVISFGVLSNSPSELEKTANFNINMSIQDIAPKLEVTGKALAREIRSAARCSQKKYS